MHPTADTRALIYNNRAGRRVMPGVRLLWVSEKEVLHDVEKIFCHFVSIHTLRLGR